MKEVGQMKKKVLIVLASLTVVGAAVVAGFLRRRR